MSKSSTPVDAELFAFLAARTIAEDAHLQGLRAAARAAGLPEIHIAPEQAAFLQLLLRAIGARLVIEVGTLGGYSAIAMARGLPPGGRVISYEIDPQHAGFARHWIESSDQRDRIEVRIGDAQLTLAELPAASADAMFIDADKEGYVGYLRHGLRIVRPGGVLLADNVLASGHLARGDTATAQAMRSFLDAAAAVAGLEAVIVPLGDGCWFGIVP